MKIPSDVRKFTEQLGQPSVVIGCRTSSMSLDCCEYDLAVFAPGKNEVVQINDRLVEVMHFDGAIKNQVANFGDAVILRDTNKFMLSSAIEGMKDKRERALLASGRKSLINSLFYQQRMSKTQHPIVAAMWLKMAAYEFVDGTLAMLAQKPMPLHELQQIRQVDSVPDFEIAFECIGIDRATRPAIARSLEAIKEIKSGDYDKELFMSKVQHLLDRSMLADCYFYAGRICAKSLVERKESFHVTYSKLIHISLDLSNDLHHLKKLQKKLFAATQSRLQP